MAELETAEIADLFTQSQEDIMVGDDGSAYYGGRRIVDSLDGSPDWLLIAAWAGREHYWPNVWTVNDHGNVELHDVKGNCYGGLV